MPDTHLKLTTVSKTDRGRRAENEDYAIVDDELGLYVLADGTGGRSGGRIAAEVACRTIQSFVQEGLSQNPEIEGDACRALLESSIIAANDAIVQKQHQDASLSGAATTIVIALCCNDKVYISHVGDSRLYRFRNRHLDAQTRDHSLENFLADNPQINPKIERPGSTLVRALGLSARPPEPDHKVIDLAVDDILLLCSDGVTESLSERVMSEILVGATKVSENEAVDCLVRAALSHGAMDNITAILVRARVQHGRQTAVVDANLVTQPEQHQHGWLVFFEGPYKGQVIPLAKSTTIGAGPGCPLILTDAFVSKQHAEILETDRGYAVRDLNSTNGTFLNNIPVKQQALVDGDVVRIGGISMTFKAFC